MKFLTLIVIIMSAILASCASTGTTDIQMTCSEFDNASVTKDATVNEGSQFTLTVCSNPTTGYSWETPQVSDAAAVQIVDHKIIPPGSTVTPAAVGAAGTEKWTFKAASKGKTTITNSYSRPWVGGEKGTWTYTLNVTVQ